jgi:hypothetical protein
MSDDTDWLAETAVQDLSAFHDVPWTMLEGMHATFRIEYVERRAGVDEPVYETEEREGVIVGRGEGRGVRYDSGERSTMETTIGPAVYLETPEDTILEVRTDKSGNELLDIYPPHKVDDD